MQDSSNTGAYLGLVSPHQDRAFLYTEPASTLGFWVPLEDCTMANGCLHAIPGSHKRGLDNERRMVRNDDDSGTHFIGGDLPKYDRSEFIPLETKAGTLVIIHGDVVHESQANTSEKPRPAYTWHIIDGNSKYSTRNWLQPSAQVPFMPLYT